MAERIASTMISVVKFPILIKIMNMVSKSKNHANGYPTIAVQTPNNEKAKNITRTQGQICNSLS